MSTRLARGSALVGGGVAAVLVLIIVCNSARWLGSTFPGFFVMSNRVVPSITLPDWPDPSALFQHQVLQVDGEPIATAAEVYELVARRPSGSRIRYTLRGPDGTTTTAVIRSRTFSRSDYVFLFGSFLLTGSAFILTGLLVFALKPRSQQSLALLCTGLATGVFGVTGVDLYGPHWFFRLHVIGETFLAPGFIHLALVFPTDRIWRHRRIVLLAVYLPFLFLVGVYQAALMSPSAYSSVHLVVTAAQGFSGIMIISAVAYDLVTTKSALVRRRLGVVALGTVSGFVVPTALMAGSGLFAGSYAVNGAALTAFFFPFTLGYAIVKQDLFDIDVMLRRAMTYGLVVVTIATLYFLALYVLGVLVPGQFSSWSPVALALLNFGLLFLIAPVRERMQEAIDRVFFRQGYQVEEALSSLSLVLASAHAVDEVVGHARRLFAATFSPNRASIFLRGDDGRFREVGAAEASGRDTGLPADLAGRLERGEIVARYEWEDGSQQPMPPIWSSLEAELLVPIRTNDVAIGMMALAAKSSGRPYSIHDIALLRTASNQVALALTNATAFGQLEELNVNLERKVRERTGALRTSNAELNRSLDKLRQAYAKLEQNQASLLRTDRLATLGRLTAGIAHEMNTPLSAVLNALRILNDLGQEYAAAVDDPEVLPTDHQEIAGEIVTTAQAATTWAQKAAAYISSVKAHGREARPAVSHSILVSNVIDETRVLLSHRLRTAACRIDFEEEPSSISLVGDPARLNQVMLNLCANAVDAYEDAGVTDGRVCVQVERKDGTVTITVRDWAGGIPADVVPHIFEELYTTKGPGRGTGLGLWIARNLVEQGFGGTLTVDTVEGVGSCFTATIPAAAAGAAARSTQPPNRPRPAKDTESVQQQGQEASPSGWSDDDPERRLAVGSLG